jgi:hypothetical protein
VLHGGFALLQRNRHAPMHVAEHDASVRVGRRLVAAVALCQLPGDGAVPAAGRGTSPPPGS